MKIRFIVFAVLFFAFSHAKGQYYFYNGQVFDRDWVLEVGGSVGGMNAFTDLGGRKGIGKKGLKDFNIQNTHLAGSIFVGTMYKNAVGARIEATFGKVSAYDSILKNVAASTNGRYERHLEFQSKIAEAALLVELHPFEMFMSFDDDNLPPEVSPYVIGGLGYFHFNPQATLNGGLVDLQPLSTEGQGFQEYPRARPYKLNQINFPIGIGGRYDITSAINIRVELLYRILRTDYLDDVSTKYIDPIYFFSYLNGFRLNQALLLHDRHIPGAAYSTAHPDGIRGNPKDNDGYVTLSIKIGLTLGRESR